jgi:putative colanic acid biosynthesis acetyltransferase WcaF
LVVEAFFLLNPIFVSYRIKTAILRFFGASIGKGLVIKPGVHIKYPWRLSIGDHVWLGERVWIDNLADVEICANVCISQGAYLCTGNHDWSDPHLGLVTQRITVNAGAWIAAFAKVAPGVRIGEDAIIALGAILVTDAEPGGIYAGNPAKRIGTRFIRDPKDSAQGNGRLVPPGTLTEGASLAHEEAASVDREGL